jgi:hypothetical protein
MALKMSGPKPRSVTMQITEALGPLMVKLLECANSAVSPQVGRAYLAPGNAIAWDDCCNGQLWVRLVSLDSLTFAKMGATAVDPCGLTWTATIGLGILRCSSTISDRGEIASAEVVSMETLQMLADEAALCEAIYCCDALPLNKFVVTRWDPLGPEGGCVGGEWTMTMQVNNYGCSDT